MGIFRGEGGTGDSTTDAYASLVAQDANFADLKAQEAAQSAADALQSANDADADRIAAETARDAAEAAQNAAEAAQEAIDGLYLGPQASDPTLDLNGNPVTVGDWYFNTTTNGSRVYDGVAWNTIDPSLVFDTSPELGGNLDGLGNDITNVGNITVEGGSLTVNDAPITQTYSTASNAYLTQSNNQANGSWSSGVFSDGDYILTGGAGGTIYYASASTGTVTVPTSDISLTVGNLEVAAGNITVGGTVDGRDVAADGTKLDGIESGAQVNVGTNLSATADGTQLQVNSSTGNNVDLPAATTSAWGVMTDEDKTKLDGIATGAEVNVDTNISVTEAASTVSIDSSTGTGDSIQAATTSLAGVMTASDKTKLDGIAAGAEVNVGTNLSATVDGTQLQVNSSTGNNVDLPAATTSAWGVMTDEDKTKLDGISSGAEVNVGTDLGIIASATNVAVTSSTGTDASIPVANGTGAGIITSATFDLIDSATSATISDAIVQRDQFGDFNTRNIRLTGTADVSLSSTAHPFQIGPTTGSNLVADGNEIMARNNGATSTLFIQNDGGNASFGGNITVPALGTVDGRDVSVDGAKLDGIAPGAEVNVGTNLGRSVSGTGFTLTSSTGNNTTLPAATTSAWGVMTDEDKAKLDGIESGADVNVGTNITVTENVSTVTINSSTGTGDSIATATGSLAGVMSATDKTKLDASTTSATASTLVERDGSRDINVRLLKSDFGNQTTISGAIAYRINNSTDNFTRYCSSPSAVRTWLGVDSSGTINYVHPNDGGGNQATLTGALVYDDITINTLGHVTGTSTRSLTAADIGAVADGGQVNINVADALSFENGKHWITYNDGQGNFNIRMAHKSNSSTQEECTEAGYIAHWEYSNASGLWNFQTSNASMAVSDFIGDGTHSWRSQLQISPTYVSMSHSGSTKIQTTSTGVTVSGSIVVTGTVDGRDIAADGVSLDGLLTTIDGGTY